MGNVPFRYDFVGSFLRPQALKDAKEALDNGQLSQEDYDRIVDEEVVKVVKKQKELGYHVITDGEFRRTFWHLDFMWGFEGVEHKNTGNGVRFNTELAVLDDTYLVGKIKAKAHPFVEYFKFLKQFEDENTVAKYTIPAPAQTFQQMIVPANFETTRKFYATNEELIHDIGVAYQDVIKQFYDAGCRNLQLDDCTWGAIVGDAAKQRYESLGIDLEEVKAELLAVNNLALENKPEDMVITSHICRGNYHSTFFAKGPYNSVADYVFAKENVDALYLEYDDERSGGFAPLAKVSEDKKVVLKLEKEDIKDILQYDQIINISKWDKVKNDAHYLLYDEYYRASKKSVKKVVYYIDSYYERMEDLNYLGYTKNVLFKNSDLYTISNLDTLISANVPYKKAKKYLAVKGAQIQDIKKYVDSGLSPLKAVLQVSYPGID